MLKTAALLLLPLLVLPTMLAAQENAPALFQNAANLAAAGFTVYAEQILELLEEVVLRTEMAEVLVALGGRFLHLLLHLQPVEAVE